MRVSTVQISTSQAHETRARLFNSACGSFLFVTYVATDKCNNRHMSKTTECGNGYLPSTVQTSEAMLLSATTASRPTEGTELLRALKRGFGVKEHHPY